MTVRMAPDVSEADFMRTVLDMARMFRWRVAHFRPALTVRGWRTAVSGDGKGFPDLVCIRGDRLVVAELKTATGRTTPDQEAWLSAFRMLPFAEVFTWRPADVQAIAEVLR